MRTYPAILYLFALIAAVLARPPPLKTVVVSYSSDTPASIVDKAIEEVNKAGGVVTHQYSLIKGFTAKVSDSMIQTINTLSSDKYPAFIEQDSIITISGSS